MNGLEYLIGYQKEWLIVSKPGLRPYLEPVTTKTLDELTVITVIADESTSALIQ